MIYKAPKSQKESGRIKRIRAHVQTICCSHLTTNEVLGRQTCK